MASGPSVSTLVTEPLEKPFSREAAQQQNGNSHLPKLSDDANSSEVPAIHDIPNGHVLESKQDQNNLGEKREFEATSTARPSADTPAEPNAKKQKTSKDNADAIDGASTSAQSGQAEPTQTAPAKKKGGRLRKTKDRVPIRKDIPTDGIGSRTRSRTKVVS
ncbi:uncharacterized protein BDV17DRAFT_157796 [Aspergillus undulatus]|uniref:uncharacterized protein n=1 Tax=Aspergillus undulatus TaxID=1810928 RepID=UPI003CCDD1B6